MDIKAYIFDLDGTIVDSVGSIAACANARLKEVGLEEQPIEAYNYFAGDGQNELIRRALYAAGDEKLEHYDEVMKRYIECFKDTCYIGCKAYEGMKETLNTIKQSGIKIAVLSNKAHINAVKVVEEVYGKGFFDCIYGQREEVKRKPSPEGVHIILNDFNIKPEEVIYVGDTSVDMQTGKNAGVYTVGVTWGFRSREELEENNADEIIDEPKQLLSLDAI